MKRLKGAFKAFLLWAKEAVESCLLDLLLSLKGGETIMAIATIYVTLIMEGDKIFAQVPKQDKLRTEVKRQLEVLGFPELAQ